jgi:pyruvate,water dikinase
LKNYVVRLADCRLSDLAQVGHKNASLGEMIGNLSNAGVQVPDGFATTASAFQAFLGQDGLGDTIQGMLQGLDVSDVGALARRSAEIRNAVMSSVLPAELQDAVSSAWHEATGGADHAFAIRSSATADDVPETVLIGQQQALLNVNGLSAVISGVHEIYASFYSDRAIAYRAHHGIEHTQVALSVGVQRMVRSDLGRAGVMFTLDTESGFRHLVLITSTYGLGQSIVEGAVSPDEFYVFKPTLKAGKQAVVRRILGAKASKMVSRGGGNSVHYVDVPHAEQQQFSLSDDEVLELARLAVKIERHYGQPMEIEWAKDGLDNKLYMLEATPETVQSRNPQGTVHLQLEKRGRVLTSGRRIGQRVGGGRARVMIDARDMSLIQRGDVLVTDMTTPDWEPVLRHAAAIVTDRGGRTSHAAIVARELGIPAVVGCGNATAAIADGTDVTVSCAEGDEGFVYEGRLDYELREFRIGMLPQIPVKIMMNIGNPDRAFSHAATPNFGVGLVRLEFIINRMIGVHPLALLAYETLNPALRKSIGEQMPGYSDPTEFFVGKLSEGIACIAAAVAPHPAIVRLSDFKSNEYASLIGGEAYEPKEENPMLGFRGAARYIDKQFRKCFELECRALRRVRNDMGLTNVMLMIPYIRTVDEASLVIKLLEDNGLKRGDNGLKILMMCETPANALCAEEFLPYFDGMSIGSNDMTQLTLGVDRDSARIGSLFDEGNAAVRQLFTMAITACKRHGKYIGICGQGPSDYLELAQWLAGQGIDSLSVEPDAVIPTWLHLAKHANSSS